MVKSAVVFVLPGRTPDIPALWEPQPILGHSAEPLYCPIMMAIVIVVPGINPSSLSMTTGVDWFEVSYNSYSFERTLALPTPRANCA